MNKPLKIIILSLVIGACVFFNYSGKILAEQSTGGPIVVTYDSAPLFNASNLKPGDKIVRTIKVKNTGQNLHTFQIASLATTGSLASYIQLAPTVNNVEVWKKSFVDLDSHPSNAYSVMSLSAGQEVSLDLVVYIDPNMGNHMQGSKIENVNLIFGDSDTDQPEMVGGVGGQVSSSPSVSPYSNPSPSSDLSSLKRGGLAAVGGDNTDPSIEEPGNQVLGANNESGGDVKGASQANSQDSESKFPWWILWLLLIIIIYYTYRKMRESKE